MKDIEKALKLKKYINPQLIIPKEYHNLLNIFKKQNINQLLLHQKEYNIEIELEFKKISNFNQSETSLRLHMLC